VHFIGDLASGSIDLIAFTSTAQAVEKAGWPVGAMPRDSFHLKPLIAAFGKTLAEGSVVDPAREGWPPQC